MYMRTVLRVEKKKLFVLLLVRTFNNVFICSMFTLGATQVAQELALRLQSNKVADSIQLACSACACVFLPQSKKNMYVR